MNKVPWSVENSNLSLTEQAKLAYGGSVLGSSQFTLLPQLPLKTTLDLKVVKTDSKVIISLP